MKCARCGAPIKAHPTEGRTAVEVETLQGIEWWHGFCWARFLRGLA